MPSRKDLQKILDDVMKYLELRSQNDHERMYEKLEQIMDEMMIFPQIQTNFTRRDLEDRLSRVCDYLQKWLHTIGREDMSAYIQEMFAETYAYHFFFPAPELRDFPNGFNVGYCKLSSFLKLPNQIKPYISGEWKYRYAGEKKLYPQTFDEYVKRKENELYFCLDVTAFGRDKATIIASENANKSLSILKSIYGTNLSPLKECSYYVDEKEWLGGIRPDGFQIQRPMPTRDRRIDQINEIFSKKGPTELERRIQNAIGIYGMIEMTTPLNIRFLLTVMSIEGLLIGSNEKDYIGWKLREKIALLLGDCPWWLATFLGKKLDPESLSEEEVYSNLVNSRIALTQEIKSMYGKRSSLVHPQGKREKKEITEEDFEFAESVYLLLLTKLLDLRSAHGLTQIEAEPGKKSLNLYLDRIKFSSRN